MKIAFLSLVAVMVSVHPLGADPPVFDVAASLGYLSPGQPPATPRLGVVSGKPLEVRWHVADGDGEVALKVERITDTRRVPVADGVARREGETLSWIWEPPLARGPAIYEVTLASSPMLVTRIDVREEKWVREGLAFLQAGKWSASGLDATERAGLAALGLKVSAGSGASAGTPVIAMTPGAGRGTSRREVVLSADPGIAVVWQPGAAAGDWRLSVPRWWFSKESLASDQGKIHMIELFVDPPSNS